MSMIIKTYDNQTAASHAAADLFVQTAGLAIEEKGWFSVALTGGSSPVRLYDLLAKEPYVSQVSWEKIYVFWGDERWVPLHDPMSNAGMAYERLLAHVAIPKEQVYPMWQEHKNPEAFAADYEEQLTATLGTKGDFDLVLLGMGEDGHTASLFPHTAVLEEQEKWVAAYYLEPQKMYRMTLTAPLINRAKKLVFLVFGENKAFALNQVLEGEENFRQYPAQLINPVEGEVYWLVDNAAASSLSG